MPIPDFIAELRDLIGPHPLWLPGMTAVICRPGQSTAGKSQSSEPGAEMLCVRRSDNGRWTPVTGIVDPGEAPGMTAVREAREEAGVEIRVDRLVGVFVVPEVVYPNGDRSAYLDITFACTWLSGEPYPADDESTEARFFPLEDLPPMTQAMMQRVEAALTDEVAARF